MMRSIIVLSLALLLVACKHEKEYSGNPIVEGWYADPEGVVFDDEYWIYPTLSDIPFGADSADFPVHSAPAKTQPDHPVFPSKGLRYETVPAAQVLRPKDRTPTDHRIGKRMLVPKDRLIVWIDRNTGGDHAESR